MKRMHRTMKRRAIRPLQRTCASQQQQFDAFRAEYNTERRHEALGMTRRPRTTPRRHARIRTGCPSSSTRPTSS
jgi:putative transposase